MRIPLAIIAFVVLFAAEAPGQAPPTSPPDSSHDATVKQWEFYASAYTYAVPHSQAYANPNFTANRGRLHLEARYNYEAHQTGSLWAGANFKVGSKLSLEASPMLGCVFGNLNGIAPGYTFSLSYGRFSVSSQAEYVFDLEDRSGNFLYTWSEFSYSPAEWLRAGIVIQRTKVYETDLDIQRGVLAGFAWKRLDFTGYVLNFGWTEPTLVFAIGLKF